MATVDMLTEFVDQLTAEAGTTHSSISDIPNTGHPQHWRILMKAGHPQHWTSPTLEDFNEGSTGATKWKDLVQDRLEQHGALIRNMGHHLFSLSKQLMDSAIVFGRAGC